MKISDSELRITAMNYASCNRKNEDTLEELLKRAKAIYAWLKGGK